MYSQDGYTFREICPSFLRMLLFVEMHKRIDVCMYVYAYTIPLNIRITCLLLLNEYYDPGLVQWKNWIVSTDASRWGLDPKQWLRHGNKNCQPKHPKNPKA